MLGQTVIIDDATTIQLLSGAGALAGLTAGATVEVSGVRNSSDAIVASRIEEQPSGGVLAVRGVVTDLGATTFVLGQLLVDYSGAVLDGFAPGVINPGDLVDVEGVLAPGGSLIASAVELENENPASAGDFVDLDGFVTAVSGNGNYSLGRIEFVTTEATVFENGSVANLSIDKRIELTGFVDENGLVEATRVRFTDTRIRVEGIVTAINADGFDVLSIPVAITDETRSRDESEADADDFVPTQLAVGDYVEVRSFKDPGPQLPVAAERVRREDDEHEVSLRGFVVQSGQNAFSVMGVTVDVASDSEFEAASGAKIGAHEFFEAATEGTFVDVEGEMIGPDRIFAEDIEIR